MGQGHERGARGEQDGGYEGKGFQVWEAHLSGSKVMIKWQVRGWAS